MIKHLDIGLSGRITDFKQGQYIEYRQLSHQPYLCSAFTHNKVRVRLVKSKSSIFSET